MTLGLRDRHDLPDPSLAGAETLVHYARLYTALVRSNQSVGANDLWIAASATEHDLPLLTRNASEFRRVAGLNVVDYSVAE